MEGGPLEEDEDVRCGGELSLSESADACINMLRQALYWMVSSQDGLW